MSLIRYEAGPITTLFDDLESLLPAGFDWTGRELSGALYPSVDILESDTGYRITADIPGLSKEDVRVSVEDRVLSISGEKKRETEKKEKNRYYHFERSYGKFCRSFTLPDIVDPKSIEAKYNNGVLEVHLKKSEEARPKAIEVTIE